MLWCAPSSSVLLSPRLPLGGGGSLSALPPCPPFPSPLAPCPVLSNSSDSNCINPGCDDDDVGCTAVITLRYSYRSDVGEVSEIVRYLEEAKRVSRQANLRMFPFPMPASNPQPLTPEDLLVLHPTPQPPCATITSPSRDVHPNDNGKKGVGCSHIIS